METKTTPTANASVNEILNGINAGTYYSYSVSKLRDHGYTEITCDINAAEFSIEDRYSLQTVNIPANKRGNLSKFAGKKVSVVVTTIARSGARVNFWIKAI